VSPTLWRSSVRGLRDRPGQTALAVLGIALGVAVVVAIDLANASARRAFALATESVAGRVTHQVVGGPDGLPEEVYRRLRVEAGVQPSAPVVEGYVSALDFPGRTFHLMGVDPLAEGPFRGYLGAAGRTPGADLTALVTEPEAVLLSSATAATLGVPLPTRLRVRVGSTRRSVTVVGLLEPADSLSRQALDNLVVADIASAQELLELRGRLSRIDLILPEGPGGDAILARLRSWLPRGAEVIRAGARSPAIDQMLRAFSLNLTALSLLALLVGTFLIYNTMTFSVVRRRPSIGLLRALGVTRWEIFGLILAEALAIGVAGSLVGLAGGLGLARALTQLVTRTINDLYFVVSVRDLAIPAGLLAKGAALGLGATVLASLPSALEATGAPPRAVLSRAAIESRARRAVPHLVVAGLGLLLTGAGLLVVSGRNLTGSYAALFVLMLGFASLTPGAVVAVMAALSPLAGGLFGVLGRMAVRDVVRGLSRTGVATAALTVALSATVGVGIMVESFRGTVERWLETTLQADVYVSLPDSVPGRAAPRLDPALVRRIVSAGRTARVSTHRSVTVESPAGPVRLVVLGIPSARFFTFRLKRATAASVWPAFESGGEVIVSEPYAYRQRVGPGSTLRLRTDRGERTFRVAGVFYDYASDQGVVALSRRTYERFWDDRGASGLALRAAPGQSVPALIEALRRAAGDADLLIRSNRALREASLVIFDRTFAITAVLRLLATLVAFVGVLGALMALSLERAHEVGVLRAQGLTPIQVWALLTSETGLVGFAAGVLAIPAGVALALVLVLVINRRSFGWTLGVSIGAGVLIEALVLGLAAALLAGALPAVKMARMSPAQALRDE
jgi:putative ABC transport system permease protein